MPEAGSQIPREPNSCIHRSVTYYRVSQKPWGPGTAEAMASVPGLCHTPGVRNEAGRLAMGASHAAWVLCDAAQITQM